MRNAVRRLRQLRRPAMAGRQGLPVALVALAVVAAASTASGDRPSVVETAPAGTTVLPPAAPPTYSYPGSSGSLPGVPTPPSNSGGTSTVGSAGGSPSGNAAPELAASGIPARALQAYKTAATAANCGLPWSVLAAIGRVESNHGRFGGSTLLADGRSDPPIVGIPLDGRPGVALIRDTDQGRYDGDTAYDRAVGPMQFIPGTWALFAADGNHDGKSDPFSIDDASAAAAGYLCRAGGDLSTLAGQRDAVYSYNRSDSYVQLVLDLAAEYATGAPVDGSPAPDRAPGPLPPIRPPSLPPATFGPPPAASPLPSHSASPTTPAPPAPTTTGPAPTTTAPTTTTPAPTPGPTTTTPAPTTTTPAPTTTAPTPSPTCTPAPSPTPTATPSGSASGNAASAASAAPAPADTPSPADTTSASAAATGTPTPTPTPSPTLPTCPS
jgi:hypothetical protein